MTTICAIHKDGETWIGSDTMACMSDTGMPCGPKWVISKPWAIGVAGEHRAQSLIEFHARDVFADPPGAFTLMNRVRQILIDDGFRSNNDHGSPSYGTTFIVAHKTAVWTVGSDFSVLEIRNGELYAQGSGHEFAVGAAYKLDWHPKNLIQRALSAAMHYDVGTGHQKWIRKL